MTLGEMTVTGFGGTDCEDIAYQFDILLTRKWGRYWFDFLIQGLQYVVASWISICLIIFDKKKLRERGIFIIFLHFYWFPLPFYLQIYMDILQRERH